MKKMVKIEVSMEVYDDGFEIIDIFVNGKPAVVEDTDNGREVVAYQKGTDSLVVAQFIDVDDDDDEDFDDDEEEDDDL